MRTLQTVKLAGVALVLLTSAQVQAYSAGEVDEVCKKPQVREFSLPTYQEPENIEVAPESEFTFKLSDWTDPQTIRLTFKDQPAVFTVESNSSFHKVTAKLPPELTGKYVRIDLFSKAVLGCYQREGWLIKVADKVVDKIPTEAPVENK
jgi:hypothetical protein